MLNETVTIEELSKTLITRPARKVNCGREVNRLCKGTGFK